jgi:hypothetical protein
VLRPLDYVEATVSVELNAATDNPLVLVDEQEIVSAGNFHGQPPHSRSTRSHRPSPSSRASPSAASSGS